MIEYIVAHAGEDHSETDEATGHFLLSGYVAVPLYVALMVLVFVYGKKLKLTPPMQIIAALAISLAAGIFGYVAVPVLSIVAITFGIALALFFVLSSLL